MNQLFGQPASPDPAHSADGELAPASQPVRSAPPATPEQAIFQIDLKRSLRQHWRLALAVVLAFATLAVAYLFLQIFVRKSWPTYVAESTVYVQPTPAKVLPSAGGPGRWPSDTNTYESYIQQQMTNVSREDVLVSAVHKLDGFQGQGESDQAAAQRLVSTLQVTRDGGAYQFTISARAGDPEWAARIANASTDAYIESASRDERAGDEQRLAMLKEESDRVEAVLVSDRAEQDDLNKQLGVASISTTVPDHFDEDITQIRGELVKARTDHDAAEARYSSVGAGKGTSSAAIDAEADQMISTDAGLISMKTSLNARRAALITQMANLTPVNPQYKQDETELTKINADLDAMLKDLRAKAAARIQLQLRAELQRTGGLESQLNGQLRELVGSATTATPKLQRSSDLAADITRLQARFAAVDEQMHNIMLEDNAPAAAYQVTPAVPPLYRSKSGVFRNAVLIGIAGLFFSVIAAVVAQKLDPRLYTSSDVERILGFAPLAQLPAFNEVTEATAEEYLLRLASAIEHACKQGELKSCIFTGTGPATGVSTIVRRVRQLLEAMGQPTLLVDATGAQTPGAAAASRPSESATGLATIERTGRPTSLLQQVTGESQHEDPSLILTDTAPLAESAETEYLARFVDCAIVVIESGVTTRIQLRQAATTLQRLNVRAVGFVLNRVRLEHADTPFRISVEAVETRQQAQARNDASRSERDSSVSVRTVGQEPTRREELPKVPPMHAMFEPEVAAEAAAVARFSAHPPATAPEVCLAASAPSVSASERPKPLSVPLVETPAHTGTPAVQAGMGTASAHRKPSATGAPTVRSVADQAVAATAPPATPPATKPTAPFAEAASHFTSAPASSQDAAVPSQAAGEIAASAPAPTMSTRPAPDPASNSDVPWWLSNMPPNAEPNRPAVIWQPAKVSTSRSQQDPAEQWSSAPKANPPAASTDVAVQSAPEAPVAAQVRDPEPKPGTAVPEDQSAHLTSRLSGLRNLLFVLGVKDSYSPEEPAKANTAAGPSFDLRVERTIPHTRADEPAEMRGASPRLVTTAPEFLPPRPVVLEFEKTDPRSGEPGTRLERRDTKDRVEILPSRRGQYRKG